MFNLKTELNAPNALEGILVLFDARNEENHVQYHVTTRFPIYKLDCVSPFAHESIFRHIYLKFSTWLYIKTLSKTLLWQISRLYSFCEEVFLDHLAFYNRV